MTKSPCPITVCEAGLKAPHGAGFTTERIRANQYCRLQSFFQGLPTKHASELESLRLKCVCWLVFFLLTCYKLESSEREPQLKKNASIKLAHRQDCRAFSSLMIGCEKAQFTVGGATTPPQTGRSGWGKKPGWIMGSKPGSSTSSWAPFQILPPDFCPLALNFSSTGSRSESCELKWNLSFPSCFWSWCWSEWQKY